MVSLVAQTSLCRDGIIEYLEATGNEEFIDTIDSSLADGLSELEVLVSMMAKLCYKSLTLGHNSNITRVRDVRSNIEAAINSGH